MDPARARRLLEAERDLAERTLATGRRFRAEETDGDVFAEMSSADQHQADAASETYQQELDATIVAMESDRLAEIDDALLRLASGTYGACETCAVAIPDDRLEAEPSARFCVVHERAWELRELDLSTPVLPAERSGTQWGLPSDAGTIALGDLPTEDEERIVPSADETLEIVPTEPPSDSRG